jgi:hypothetical protein
MRSRSTPVPAGYTLQPGQPSPLGDLPGIDEDGVDLQLTIAVPDTTVVPERRRR